MRATNKPSTPFSAAKYVVSRGGKNGARTYVKKSLPKVPYKSKRYVMTQK